MPQKAICSEYLNGTQCRLLSRLRLAFLGQRTRLLLDSVCRLIYCCDMRNVAWPLF